MVVDLWGENMRKNRVKKPQTSGAPPTKLREEVRRLHSLAVSSENTSNREVDISVLDAEDQKIQNSDHTSQAEESSTFLNSDRIHLIPGLSRAFYFYSVHGLQQISLDDLRSLFEAMSKTFDGKVIVSKTNESLAWSTLKKLSQAEALQFSDIDLIDRRAANEGTIKTALYCLMPPPYSSEDQLPSQMLGQIIDRYGNPFCADFIDLAEELGGFLAFSILIRYNVVQIRFDTDLTFASSDERRRGSSSLRSEVEEVSEAENNNALDELRESVRFLKESWPPPDYGTPIKIDKVALNKGTEYRIQFMIDYIIPVARTGWLMPDTIDAWNSGFERGFNSMFARDGEAADIFDQRAPEFSGCRKLRDVIDRARTERPEHARLLREVCGVDPDDQSPAAKMILEALPKDQREKSKGGWSGRMSAEGRRIR